MSWSKYTSISSVENQIGNLLGREVEVIEKIDGSNFSILIDENGGVAFFSRSQRLPKAEEGMFAEAIRTAKEIVPTLAQYGPATFYFEFFGAGIQKRIPYSDNQHLALIDVKPVGENYLNPEKMRQIGERCGLYVAPSFGIHTVNVELIDRITAAEGPFEFSQVIRDFAMLEMENPGDLGDRIRPEGFVLRPLAEERDFRGNRLIAKVKQEWFCAREHKAPRDKSERPQIPAEIIEFALNSVDFDRLASVYSHGEFEPQYAMPDMKHLVRLVPADIRSEGDPIWETHNEKAIVQAITQRLPKVLKDYLMEINTP